MNRVFVKKAMQVETEREADGRWIAEVPELPGVMAYGSTEEKAIVNAQALALRVLADRIEERTRSRPGHS